MDHLQFFHRAINVEDQVICKYLSHHLKSDEAFEIKKEILASDVDPDKLVKLCMPCACT